MNRVKFIFIYWAFMVDIMQENVNRFFKMSPGSKRVKLIGLNVCKICTIPGRNSNSGFQSLICFKQGSVNKRVHGGVGNKCNCIK
jgi:hypothetical protein